MKHMIRSQDALSLKCYDPKIEYQHTVTEANLLYWVICIFQFMHLFIETTLQQLGSSPAHLTIPDICLVDRAVALVHNDVASGATVRSALSLRCSFLIAELIDELFVKFVNNRSAKPCLAANHPLFLIAEFLCFTQHVQYKKLGKLVFLSDYQGPDLLMISAASYSLFHSRIRHTPD
ncbi:unnamed protein product [Mycena citricolor]|uniref:Alpha-type protein kinase domain-containing protein n=1 Tax=Mycena citricolor TaxID=2018698 RepID=A0AAD2H9Q5_9AGAR|nr:unnamed protein product [Mycena citricolor]